METKQGMYEMKQHQDATDQTEVSVGAHFEESDFEERVWPNLMEKYNPEFQGKTAAERRLLLLEQIY